MQHNINPVCKLNLKRVKRKSRKSTMAFKKLLALSVAALSVSLINIFLIYYLKKQNKIKKSITKETDSYKYKFMFITSNNFECVNHVYKNLTCGDRCSNIYLKKILTTISSAEKTISLCMYHLSLESIATVIIKAHKRKVKVRVVTDKEMTFVTGSQINHLIKSGVEVKTPIENIGLLHHKFCLIDEYQGREAQLIFGSMNYTLQGLCNNWENITITDDLGIIKEFRDGFEDLWYEHC